MEVNDMGFQVPWESIRMAWLWEHSDSLAGTSNDRGGEAKAFPLVTSGLEIKHDLSTLVGFIFVLLSQPQLATQADSPAF